MKKRYANWEYPEELADYWFENSEILNNGWEMQRIIDHMKSAIKTYDLKRMLYAALGASKCAHSIIKTIGQSNLSKSEGDKVRNDTMKMHQEICRLMY